MNSHKITLAAKLEQLHAEAKQNRWLGYFAIFNRFALAAGFIPAGFVKIMGERFTSLAVNHPMGHYLEALSLTGYYYPFIGYLQVTAAVLLIIPRTVTLGALLYFPIILNICILSFAVRFEGSLLSSPLMVLANLYLLFWNYDKLKFILPFNHSALNLPEPKPINNKFPLRFFMASAVTVLILVLTVVFAFDIMPRNTFNECMGQCRGSNDPKAVTDFCDCIHNKGKTLDKCLDDYHKALKTNVKYQ
jgi:uncharacterized membrane protein YphA (DoxX/SURF4 family)